MKKFLCLLSLSVLLVSCAKTERHTQYRHAESLAPLATSIKALLDDDTLVEMDEDAIEFTVGISSEEYEEGFVLLSTSGASIDEVGVFVTDKEDTEAVAQKLENYLSECKKNKAEWLNSYNPPEAEKLKNGQLYRYGDCLVYAFLSPDKEALLSQKVEAFLAEEPS